MPCLYYRRGAQTHWVYSSVDIPMAEGPVNLNWGPIMKTINDSPYDFFQTGGWHILRGTGAADVSHSLTNP